MLKAAPHSLRIKPVRLHGAKRPGIEAILNEVTNPPKRFQRGLGSGPE